MTKEFTFEEVVVKSRAVDGNKLFVFTRRAVMDGLGDEFFTRTVFALNENCALRSLDLVEKGIKVLHRLGFADHGLIAVTSTELIVEFLNTALPRRDFGVQSDDFLSNKSRELLEIVKLGVLDHLNGVKGALGIGFREPQPFDGRRKIRRDLRGIFFAVGQAHHTSQILIVRDDWESNSEHSRCVLEFHVG